LRQLNTKFGIRSKRVFLVWTRFDGAETGEGQETRLAEVELLPTPKIADLSSVALNPYSVGTIPIGSIRVTEVSAGQYTLDDLMGEIIPGLTTRLAEMPEVSFFYEMREDGRGDDPPSRDRFRLVSQPNRDEGGVQWQFILERSSQDRSRAGLSTYGSGGWRQV
jgi:hypothetical protein